MCRKNSSRSRLNQSLVCRKRRETVSGYARTSTGDRLASFEGQIEQLKRAGRKRIFFAQVSAVASRPLRTQRLQGVWREGDCLIVPRLDRLSRSTGRCQGGRVERSYCLRRPSWGKPLPNLHFSEYHLVVFVAQKRPKELCRHPQRSGIRGKVVKFFKV